MSNTIPTERKILRCIYDMYKDSFPVKDAPYGTVFIPIDIEEIAKKLGYDKHLLFGYIYSFISYKYEHRTGPNSRLSLFEINVADIRHPINFPYLAAILAAHDQEHSKFVWSLTLSIIALIVSISSIALKIAT